MSPALTTAAFLAAMLAVPASAAPQAAAGARDGSAASPARILIHVTHGPEHPTRAALAFAVAAAAAQQGHQVTMFLAGDAVQLLRRGVVEQLTGLGTGKLAEQLATIVAKGGRFYLSGGSSAARGLEAGDVAVERFEMAGPAKLVELALEHDRQFVY